jgi:hypothetical protein
MFFSPNKLKPNCRPQMATTCHRQLNQELCGPCQSMRFLNRKSSHFSFL